MSGPKKIIVTGATGFVGSHLASWLVKQGHDVMALVRQSHSGFKPPLKEDVDAGRIQIASMGLSVEGRYSALVSHLKQFQPDAVVHLATHFVGVHQVTDLIPLADSNVLFGMQLLEAMQTTCPKARLVVAGTAWQHYDSAAYDPVSLYAATKQAFEDILKFYRNVAGMDAVILKLFDSYGPNDYRGKLFHHLRTAAKSGKELQFSKGEQYIDLIYIQDIAQAFVRALDRSLPAGEYAVSSGRAIHLKEMIEIYQRVTGWKLNIRFDQPYRPREMMTPWNVGKALPHWSPEVSLEQGIRLMEGLSER